MNIKKNPIPDLEHTLRVFWFFFNSDILCVKGANFEYVG